MKYVIAIAVLLSTAFISSAEFHGLEAYDEKGDCSSDGNKVDFPDGDLIYSSVIEKNGYTILIAEVLGKMRENTYCEFNIYTSEETVRIYYNGGHIFVYKDSRGGIKENCTFKIEKNKIEISLPWLFKNIENVSVNIDLREGSYWYFDKIPIENFHPLSEKKKTGGFGFVGIIVSIAILYFILKIYNKHL
ncbi:MAG TPA: hypothetical protein ENI33_06390 [Thermoplasmatales archaeon]|nr:hypothetical protein [Thermoplasmatales archaeon]